MTPRIQTWALLAVCVVATLPRLALAQDKPSSLDDLLKQVKQGGITDSGAAEKRVAEFAAAKDRQESMLKEALDREQALMKQGTALEHQFEANEKTATELEELLRKRLGTSGELFGVVRQVAGDTRAHLYESLTTAHVKDREKFLDELAQSKKLPNIEQLEQLWYIMQQEMTEQGKIVRFKTEIIDEEGQKKQASVIRVGAFNAVADGKYLRWLPDVGKLAVLGRQPERKFLATVSDLEQAKSGMVRFAVDPSSGSILGLLVQTPKFREQIEFGGVVGYVIIALGAATLLLAVLRLIYLMLMSVAVEAQRRNPQKIGKLNPLGRVLGVFSANRDLDVESLERKLDEVVLRESSRIERFQWAIKVVSVVAPLLGLLGTVTGMIKTFQAITLFGTGDPKLMANGISEALVTTMLGLVVAIPLVLMHSVVRSTGRRMIDVLYEQGAGIIAAQIDPARASAPAEKGAA